MSKKDEVKWKDSFEIDQIRRRLNEAYQNREYPHRFVISARLYHDLKVVLDQAYHTEHAQEPKQW